MNRLFRWSFFQPNADFAPASDILPAAMAPKKLHNMRTLPAILSLAILFVTFSATHMAFAEITPSDDPMLKAMQLELDREKAQLLLPGMQRPYFIEYHLDDIDTYEALANYGALTLEQANHQRIVRVSVRVGDYANDSSSARGDGVVQLAPKDDNPLALRYALWTATDEAYKGALRSYAAKQAALKRFQSPPSEKDFAPVKPVTHIDPLATMDLDRGVWKKRVIEASGLYASDPEVRSFAEQVQYSTANIRAVVLNRYLVNTEGTVVRQGSSSYNAAISVGGQASDGMRLGRDNGSVATSAKDLESPAAFHKRVIDDLKSFNALRNAPVVAADDYHGPVLFSGDAAADTFNRLFVPNVEADRPEMGTAARTQGAYSSSLHAAILPEPFNVVDNPGLGTFAGQTLLGAYAIDDEGVPAQAVDLVVNGKLQNYLLGRGPIKDFPDSNGHGRGAAGQPAHSHSGVMLIKSNAPLSAAAMNAKLLGLAKDQGHDVYAVDTLGGELAPRLLYRVHADGSRDLVRGASFDELDVRTLRSDIQAVGDDATAYVANAPGPIPQTTIAPAILFGDIGVKRANEEQQKLPYYAPPVLEIK
ncbi:MAG: peptidase modulator of gyrase [Acidobacteriaceae bacterium]|nr:peptidase modulator of gyrase [Acidobacteriaceae bacterium]